MVYDCFPFFNELDILEIRLNELNQVVDKFVLVESAKTFQNQDKPFFFEENKERYAKFLDKIIHIKLYKVPAFNWKKLHKMTPWNISNWQKNQVKQGLKDCQDNDTLIIGDVDEIPRASKVKELLNNKEIVSFEQLMCCYHLNRVCYQFENETVMRLVGDKAYWRGSMMLPYHKHKSFVHTRTAFRNANKGIKVVENSGWHFSYIGDAEHIIKKATSFEHAGEDAYKHSKKAQEVNSIIERGDDIYGRNFKYRVEELTKELFPSFVVENQDKFSDFLAR